MGEQDAGHGEHEHETVEEFVDEAEVAAWQTIEEIKDLPHDAKRLAEEGWDKIRHLGHHDGSHDGRHDGGDERPEGSGPE